MNRYYSQTIDQAKQLDNWVQGLAKEVNKDLIGGELHDISLSFNDFLNENLYNDSESYTGNVGMQLKFEPKEPNFLIKNDRESWYSRMEEIAENIFDIKTIVNKLEYATIPFSETSKEDLYIFTFNKESQIKTGFDRIKRFFEWYSSAVKDYENVVQAHDERMLQYLASLETLAE